MAYFSIEKLFTQWRKAWYNYELKMNSLLKTMECTALIYTTNSEQETEAVGAALAEKLPGGSVVAMYGDLGSGKTAFVRGMARGMGLTCRVSSPTFTIVNEYLGKRDLIHFDMYRLGSADELFDIGWEDYLNRGAVCAVEWSENVPEAFYGDEVRVTFEKLGDHSRRITIEGAPEC